MIEVRYPPNDRPDELISLLEEEYEVLEVQEPARKKFIAIQHYD